MGALDVDVISNRCSRLFFKSLTVFLIDSIFLFFSLFSVSFSFSTESNASHLISTVTCRTFGVFSSSILFSSSSRVVASPSRQRTIDRQKSLAARTRLPQSSSFLLKSALLLSDLFFFFSFSFSLFLLLCSVLSVVCFFFFLFVIFLSLFFVCFFTRTNERTNERT